MIQLKEDIKNGKWTLFLDRDGVINHRPINDYVRKKDDFKFINGVLDSLSLLKSLFSPIVVVTNQQGVAKGLMSMKDVDEIHQFMIKEIENNGGKIDAVYTASQMKSEKGYFRKPGVGMGAKAKRQFPEICFSKSVMIGDTMSDMLFAKRLKMKSVYIGTAEDYDKERWYLVDYRFLELKDFTKYITQ